MANINGFFQNMTIWDTKGETNNTVSGFGNTVNFRGDNGANAFDISGGAHNIDIRNLGRDDQVNLKGPGWEELADNNAQDGVLRFYNKLNGSYAEVHTDGGRDDAFVRARVQGATDPNSPNNPDGPNGPDGPDGHCAGHGWDQLGQMAPLFDMLMGGLMQSLMDSMMGGVQDQSMDPWSQGFQSGRMMGQLEGAWAMMNLLGPHAWSGF